MKFLKVFFISLSLFVIAGSSLAMNNPNVKDKELIALLEETTRDLEKNSTQELLNIIDAPEITQDMYKKIENIVKKGWADLNIKKSNGDTALLWATHQNDLRIVKMLIDARVDLDEQDINGNTALMWTTFGDRSEIAQALINAGANLDKQNYNKQTALIYSISFGNFAQFQRLIIAGANVNLPDNDGNTPLMYAVNGIDINMRNNLEVAKRLIASGADVNQKNNKNVSPFQLAYSLRRTDRNRELLKLLIEAKANLEFVDHNGATPLLNSAEIGDIDTVKLLLAGGANSNAQDRLGNTALNVAVQKNNLPMVILLAEAGADPNIEDRNGESALLLAKKNDEIWDYLFEFKRLRRLKATGRKP